MNIKQFSANWLPPALRRSINRLIKQGLYFSGHFGDWETAKWRATGYDSTLILERVKHSALKVKSGEAVFERDSVVFDINHYSFPVLAGLFRAAAAHNNQLSVLDFGGSLGSIYFQCKDFISTLTSVQWNIVEQENFVKCGKELFETDQLHFFKTIDECLGQCAPNVALLSSVLQYLPDPYQILDKLMDNEMPCIIIDRTPFAHIADDFVTIQHVPPSIYRASYACWIFAYEPFIERISSKYEMLAYFDSNDGSAFVGKLPFKFGGMILCKK